MYCYKCGQELGENAKFCSKCGLKIIDDELIDLVVKMQEGSSEAFELFYGKTEKDIKSIVYSVLKTNSQDAEDVVQEIYLTVYQKIGTLNNPDGIKAWLRTTARNLAITYAQKSVNKESKVLSVDELSEEGMQFEEPEDTLLLPEDVMINKERQQAIHKMLKELPEMQYKVMLEYYFSEKTAAEISEQLGVHAGTVKSYLSKARDKMQQKVLAYQRTTGVALRSFGSAPILYMVFKACAKETIGEAVAIGTFSKVKEKLLSILAKKGKGQAIQEAGKAIATQTAIKTAAVVASVSTVAVGVGTYVTHDSREIKKIVYEMEAACQTLDEKALQKCFSEESLKAMKGASMVDEYVNPQVMGYSISDRTDFSLKVEDVVIDGDEAVAYCVYSEEEHEGTHLSKSGYIKLVFENNDWKLELCRLNKELLQTGGDLGNIRFPEIWQKELVFNDELEK